MHFFMPMKKLPDTTHQQKKVNTQGNKPRFYEDEKLSAARSKLTAYLGQHVPKVKYKCAVRLIVKWCYPATKKYPAGTWKITTPDTDNLNKLLKDVMTKLGFWTDDKIVASEIIDKFYSDIPGIYVEILELE
ncbi:MAG: RusA family crossover junction endodeoxyribonuclease [Coprobacillaceae bacterium]